MRGAKPAAALATTVRRNLRLAPGETLVVAVSGGPDSVALGALAHEAAAAAGARIVLAHVNHGVRPRADQDEAIVLALGASLSRGTRQSVPVVVRALAPGRADEARLRVERYAALGDVALAYGATRVATGHHARDQAETIVLALFRGTGPLGLAGIAPARDLATGVALVRPLLETDPARLRAYCATHHFAIALDPTNDDTSLRRNAVRALLAQARPLFPGLDAAVARYAKIVREEVAGDPRATTRARLRNDLRDALGETSDVPFERIDALAGALHEGRPGRHFIRRGVKIIVE